MSFSEVKDLPVAYRKWFISRLVKDFKQKNEAMSGNENKDANHENMSKLREYEDMLSNNS